MPRLQKHFAVDCGTDHGAKTVLRINLKLDMRFPVAEIFLKRYTEWSGCCATAGSVSASVRRSNRIRVFIEL